MNNISFISASWWGTEEIYLMPGQSHSWLMWGFNYKDTLSVAAHPEGFVTEELYLAVENIKIEGGRNGFRFHFSVKNVGLVPVSGYGIGITWISH